MTHHPDSGPGPDLQARRGFPPGGVLAQLGQDTDWSRTPLGPIDGWPPCLRACASMVMASPTPMLLLWGAELTQIYNDGFATVMGSKQPGLGQAAPACWTELLHRAESLFDRVIHCCESFSLSDQRLVIERHGYPEEVIFTLSYSPVFDDAGAVAGMLVTLFETTTLARERAQEMLHASEERLQRAIAIDTVGVLFFDLKGKISYVNDAFCRMSGYSLDELKALTSWETLTDPAFLGVTAQTAANLMTCGEAQPYEKRMVRKDGSSWMGLFAPKRLSGEGRDSDCVEFVVDVTERRRTEEALRASESRYRTLFESIDEGFCVIEMVFDADGSPRDYRFLEVNPAFERHTGMTDPVGKSMREIAPEHEQYWFDIYGEIARTGVARRFEHAAATLGGRWFDVYAFRIEAPGANRVAVLFSDATQRRATETALREADRRKDEFLAMLAHELRNPLAAVVNALQLLKGAVGDSKAQRYFEVLGRQSRILRGMVDDLLDVSRATRGLVSLKKEHLDLVPLVESALASMRHEIDAKQHDVRATLPAEPVPLFGDPVRLEQALVNLLTNAAKYTDAGGRIEVDLVVHEGQAVLTVRDNGIGMAPEVLERVFELFGQAERGLARSAGGLGIGLTIAERLVQLHGGLIAASSDGEGKGSTFVVRLPVVPTLTSLSAPEEHRAETRTGKRVLLVEDNADVAETLALLLTDSGHEVAVVHDGEAALAQVSQFDPDVVLLDIGLPTMDGYEVARQLRARPETRTKILAALTGYGQPGDQAQTAAAGFDSHFVKPVDINALEEFLARIPTH